MAVPLRRTWGGSVLEAGAEALRQTMALLLEPEFCCEEREVWCRCQREEPARPRTWARQLKGSNTLLPEQASLDGRTSCLPASSACGSLSVSVFRAPFVGHGLDLVKGFV